MRITNVNIPKLKITNGLELVVMNRLNHVVLLAGKNGSGKTRLLNLIASTIRSKPYKSLLIKAYKEIDNYTKAIDEQNIQIDNYTKAILTQIDENQKKVFEQYIENNKRNIFSFEQNINQNKQILEWDLIETDKIEESYSIVPFIPKNLNLQDCNSFNKSQINNYAQQIDSLGINGLESGTFARIQITQERWHNATHQNSNFKTEEKEKAINDYTRLKDLIKIFLNTELDRDINGDPTIFGFPLGQSNLSDGQKILIQLCLAIYCQQKSLNDIILFLDEPENHLHPSVIIETLERIIKSNPNGQIWIATHSIPLLSYFDPSSIWFIENNKISYAGTTPEKVLESLLGNENQISKLQDFIGLPSVFAVNRFAFESLFYQVAVDSNKTDPQTLQIRSEIKKYLADEKKIRILDYGAGKGRLLSSIIENSSNFLDKISDSIDYLVFDKFDFYKDDCISILKKIYNDYEKRYFNDFSKLFSLYDRESFDIVIMCNVLHEIDPKDWLKLFSSEGEIPNLLRNNGILLLVEDQEINIGEKAYQKGFIVLDTQEIKEIFKIKEEDVDFGFSDARGDGRLKAHRIKKEFLIRITSESRISGLKLLHKTASEKILAIRQEECNYKNGKKHGFWIQQYANSGLAIRELTT